MMHFTCDQCGKEMRPDCDPRYAITIESRAAHDPSELTDEDLDEEHIETLSELLRDLEEGEESPLLPPPKREFRYDLCHECHERFVRDPLGKDQIQKLHFSQN
jgi:uncharacterized protein YlaI